VAVRAVTAVLALTIASGALRPAHAQGGDQTFFRSSDIARTGAFALASYGLSRFDPAITKFLQKPSRQRNPTMRKLAEGFTHVQETTLTIGGLVTYGIARLAKAPAVETAAIHATESIVAASLTSQVIRGPVGRARPKDATPTFEDQYEFHWFNGFRHFQYRAFPSIHSSSGFAAATAVVAEVQRRSPGSTWYVAPLAYAIAAGPGYSRVYLGQHWASDILMGGFIGAFYGQRVVDYAHAHRDNRVDRFFLGRGLTSGTTIVPGHGQITVTFARQF
jgi:membrane-associated phospholipid phosphatase